MLGPLVQMLAALTLFYVGGIRPAGETRRGFPLWAGRRAAARLRRIIGVRRRELRVAENSWRRYNASDSLGL